MTNSGHRALISDYIDRVWNRGDQPALEDLTTASFRYHLGGQPPRDRGGMGEFLQAMRSAFPDWRVEVVEMVVDGDRVAVRWTGRVTHEGSFHGIPPTGRRIIVSGINMYRVENGKIAEEWEQTDSLGMLQQLGVLPAGREGGR
jgi:steroid delta-isomerase-like uncharacterized protein